MTDKSSSPSATSHRDAVLFIIRDLRARLKRSPGLGPSLPFTDEGLAVIETALSEIAPSEYRPPEDAVAEAKGHAHFLKGYGAQSGANLPEVLERAEKIIAALDRRGTTVSATPMFPFEAIGLVIAIKDGEPLCRFEREIPAGEHILYITRKGKP